MNTSIARQADLQLPNVPGARTAPLRGDSWRYVDYCVRGFVYSTRHGKRRNRAVAMLYLTALPPLLIACSVSAVALAIQGYDMWAGILLVACVAAPVVVAMVYPVLRLIPRTTIYWSADNSALLVVVMSGRRKRPVWRLSDHISARPRTGSGKRLRDSLYRPLMEAADRAGVTIRANAADDRLAQVYSNELPGLVDVGRAWPRGRKLERQPQRPAVK